MINVHPIQKARQQMEKVLVVFLDRASNDPALIEFASHKHGLVDYIIIDLGIEFFLRFGAGRVTGGMGIPPLPSDIRIRANASTLDAIFTGSLSTTRAIMAGKLSISGNFPLVISYQKLQDDLAHLYQAARRTVGEKIELSGLDPKTLATFANTPHKPTLQQEDPRPEMVRAVLELYQSQLVTATGGNLSVRIDEASAWITPSQLYKVNLSPEVMVRIDLEGNSLDQGSRPPSSERAIHTEIYKARPDVYSVVHAHAPYATILALSAKPFLPITTEAAYIKELPKVPFILPGTRELAVAVAESISNNPAVLMQNHGVVVAGSSLRRAMDILQAVERTSQLILQCYAIGKRPPTLPREVVKLLQEIGEMMQ